MSSTEENHNCLFCNESFTDKESLQVHFRKHGDPQFKKESPTKNNTPENTHESEIVTEKKAELISCDVCAEVFPTISKAITHKHKVHPEHDAKYFCCWCGKLFTLKHLYNKHLTSHASETRGSGSVYHCDCCDVNFNVPSAMIYHNKIFHRQDTDLASIGQSTKQKLLDQDLCQIYYCAFCGEEYINKVNLHKHITDDHSDENQSPNEVLRCPLCQSIFYHLDAYEVHLTFHSSEDLYNNGDVSKSELTEFTLDSVPPVTEKVEEDESEQEAKSPASMDIDQLLQMAAEGETIKKHKKHKKHKKSKKSAITLDEFLNMNTDVFGEGLDFQGVEEVPTQAVSKRLKGKPQARPGAKVSKKELEKLKQQGIVIKKKSNKVPVFPGVKVQLGMQNKMQKPLKIAPCALKPPSNTPKTETQLNKVVPKTNEEVISKLLNHNQLQIRKKPGPKNIEESVIESDKINKNGNRSTTPENIEVECDLLLRSSEPSSELDPEENIEQSKVDKAGKSVTQGPSSENIKESDVGEVNVSNKNGDFVNAAKSCETIRPKDGNQDPINTNEEKDVPETTDRKKNSNSLEVLKNIQHLTVKQLKPPVSSPIPEPCIFNTPEKNAEKDNTDSDFEDAIPCTKIMNVTPPKCPQVLPKITEDKSDEQTEIISNSISQKPVVLSVAPSKVQPRQEQKAEDKTEKNNPDTVTVKPSPTQEKQHVKANSGKEVSNLFKNMGQQISIKPVSASVDKPNTSVGHGQQKQCSTSGKSTDALKNLSKHITIKPVHSKSNNDEDDNYSVPVKEGMPSAKKVIPMSQGNIKHFPQITVTSLSNKGNDDDVEDGVKDEHIDDFDSGPNNDIPINANTVLNTTDHNNLKQQQIKQSKKQFVTKSLNVLNNKHITIKSSTQSSSTSRYVEEGYDEDEAADRDFSDIDDDEDLEPKLENLPLPNSKQTLQENLINKKIVMKPTKNNNPNNSSRVNTVQLPNANKVQAANDSQPPKQIDLLQKFKQGITIKTLPKPVTEDPEIFNIDDSDSEDAEMPAGTSSVKPLNVNPKNLGPPKNNSASPTSANNINQNEKLNRKIQHNQQQSTITEPVRKKPQTQLVQRKAQAVIKNNDDIDDDFFSTDEEEQHNKIEHEEIPDICPNISKLLSNKNISLKNMKSFANQAIKQITPTSLQPTRKAITTHSPSGMPKSELLKDFRFDESSEEDSPPINSNSFQATGKELAIRQTDERMSDDDNDDNSDGENESFPLENPNQDVINKLRSMNANLSIKSNQQTLPKNIENVSEGVTMKSSSHQSNKSVTYTQSRAMKRDAAEAFSVNKNIRNDSQTMPCKQVKLAGEDPQPVNLLNQQLSDRNTVNQEVTTSVKTIQTKTVVQEITTTVTRTIKTVNQEVAVMSTQVAGSAAVTNAPRMPKFVQGMPRTPTQIRHFSNPATSLRQRAPANTAKIRPSTPARPSANTAIRSPNNVIRMRPPGVHQIRPGINRMPMKKMLPAQTNQPHNQPAGKSIKIAPNLLKQQQQQPTKRVSEPEGHFSCFKKPNDSLFPSGDTAAVASTSQISRSNFSSSTKTVKSGGAFVTATQTKSEIHSSHQEFKKLNHLSGLKVIRSSSTQAVKEVQKVEVNDPKRQSTLEAIQRLQKQGLLMKKPRLEEPDECEQSDSGCEDNDNPNLAIEDGG